MEAFLATLRLAQSGDGAAIRSLVSEFQSEVRGVCFDVQIDGADLSYTDLQQEVWLRVWSKLDQFAGSSDELVCLAMFRRWLRATARSVILNVMQSRRAERRCPDQRPVSLVGIDGQMTHEPEDSSTPSRQLSEQEELQRIRAAIAAIEPAQSRRIVEMRFLEGRSLSEIAAELGLTYDQVRQRSSAAMEWLEAFF